MPAMDEIKLSLSQSGPSGELSIVRVDGVVDTITASELENVLEKLVSQNRYKILIDLGGVEYVSSAGWGIFISRIQEIREHNGDIRLVNMIPNVYEIYELLEFENIIPAFETLEQGKKSYNLPTSGDSGGDKVWRAEEKIVTESGMMIQSAMSPGRKGKQVTAPKVAVRKDQQTPETSRDVVIGLVIEDPFSTISELAQRAFEVAPNFEFGWWKVFSILRRNKLLTCRARFRLARKRSRNI
jgi:anti-sigma B factor antagonist